MLPEVQWCPSAGPWTSLLREFRAVVVRALRSIHLIFRGIRVVWVSFVALRGAVARGRRALHSPVPDPGPDGPCNPPGTFAAPLRAWSVSLSISCISQHFSLLV